MISRALAALALGGSLLILLTGNFQISAASQFETISSEIIQRYQETLATDPDNLTLHYLLGVALLQDNHNEAALAELQIAYPAYQQSIEAHYNLAIAAQRLGDLVSAEIYLEQAEALGAMDTPGLYPLDGLYFNMAIKARQAGDANEAIRYFHKVLALNPHQMEVYRQLGDLYANRNDTDLALKSFRKYLHHFPQDAESRDYLFALEFNKAQDMLAAGDLNHAKEGFSAALALQPDSPAALYYLGYIAYAQGQPEQAVAFLLKAFPASEETVQQSSRPLLYNTALSLRRSGQLHSALNAITTLADQKTAHFNELFLAGTINLELRQYRPAQRYLQRAVSLNPQDPGARQNLLAAELEAFNEWLAEARVKLQAEDFAGAGKALQEAASLQPQNSKLAMLEDRIRRAKADKAANFFVDARTALDTGDLNTAARQVAAGLEMQPDNSDGQALRKRIEIAIEVDMGKLLAEAARLGEAGELDRAVESYQQILAMTPRQQEALEGLKKVTKARQKKIRELLDKAGRALDEGHADQAVTVYEQLLAGDPDLEQARQGLALAQAMQTNRLEEYLLKGRQALSSNRFEEARKWFNQALRVDKSPRARQELARLENLSLQQADELATQAELAVQKDQFKKAQKLFAQALQLAPGHQRSLVGQDGVALAIKASVKKQLQQASSALAQGDYSSAMTSYRAILDMAPQNSTALEGLSKVGELQAADLDAQVRQGQDALAAGDWAASAEYLDNALQKDAYHKGALELKQRLEQVRQTGAKPKDEQNTYLQGITYYTQGQYAQAIRAWETVLLLNPEHQKALQNIDKTRRKMRQIEEYRGN